MVIDDPIGRSVAAASFPSKRFIDWPPARPLLLAGDRLASVAPRLRGFDPRMEAGVEREMKGANGLALLAREGPGMA